MPATLVDAADHHVVLRPFPAMGRTMERGETVDCSTWRNVQPLINTRYLAPAWSPEGRAAANGEAGITAAEVEDEDWSGLIAAHKISLTAAGDLAGAAGNDDDGGSEISRRRPGRPRKDVA